ncbi:MAG: hypothetical protein LQ343_001230 [Gyalolechia ehrenbergii]|nr:MAG: hypothetical protein LQ343_001230 [Gyalolechia ehrenbergii]
MTDTIPSDSGTNTPVVLDLSSESDSRDIESPPVEADFCAGRQANEPVAIVGIGCRLPGEVKSAADLWNLLLEERSGQGDVPPERWNIDAFHHPKGGEKIGSMSMRGGYFIHEDLRKFENSFFGINNVEATYMDPQQRKLLEVTYECLENAGVPIEKVRGSNTGVFAGSFTMDHWMTQNREPDYLHRYHATGMGTTILSNRISHVLNLNGPSFTLDTGCSSSLYALHQACSALDANECEAAIVAASNLLQSPEQQLGTMKAGVLSATGTCHTFDDRADGYGRADGVGALYLKKLSKAISDGDPIRALIRGSAVNSLPSVDGQEAVMRKAYAKAGLSNFEDTDYVECHGTGTPVGDPIEVEAVSRVFKRGAGARGSLLIGAVKTNMGHSEATSGITSIIKATLCLENARIPATIGVKNINPKIKIGEWGVKIVTKAIDWPGSNDMEPRTRRIGVNSFGYGGANSHAILESTQNYVPSVNEVESVELSHARNAFLIPLSASKPESLEIQADRLVKSVEELSHNVVDLARTLGTRRSQLAERGFALVGQKTLADDLQFAKLQKMVKGENYSPHPFAFVFTGQGAQWPQMGKELLQEFPSFRRTIEDLDAVLQTLAERPGWTLQNALLEPKETSRIHHVTRAQPLCTAVQIALVDLLARWGVYPEGVIGHSSGEVAAAYAAGRLTAAQAIIVAFYRGYVVGKSETKVPGAMMAAGLSKGAANTDIAQLGLEGAIKVACVNSPESVTISGDEEAIEKLQVGLSSRGVLARKLITNGRAYHSHHMAPLGAEYQELLEKSLGATVLPDLTRGNVTWVSSVYAEPVTGKVVPAYWRKNLESPVLFSDAIAGLTKGHKRHLIELGPHSALEMPIRQTCKSLKIKDTDFHYSSALVRGKNSTETALNLMGQLFLHGHDVAFAKVNHVETQEETVSSVQGKVLTSLPPYPWIYDGPILWNEGRQSRELRNRKYGHHDLLGLQTLGSNGITTTWRNHLRVKDIPWVESHKLGEDIVFPAAGYMAMVIEAICQIAHATIPSRPSISLRNVNIIKTLRLSQDPDDVGSEVFTTMHATKLSGTTVSSKWYDFEVSTYDSGKTTVHATGSISLNAGAQAMNAKLNPTVELHELAIRNWYDQFVSVGLNFGKDFQSMKKVETDSKRTEMFARSSVKYLTGGGEGATTQSNYIMHPITIDSLLQTALVASSGGTISKVRCIVPTGIEHAQFTPPKATDGDSKWLVDATATPTGLGSMKMAAELHDGQGQLCAQMDNVSAVAFQGVQADESAIDSRNPMLKVIWKPDITKLSARNAPGFADYLSTAADKQDSGIPLNVRKLAEMVSAYAAKNPRVNILELGNRSGVFARHVLDLLRINTAFPRMASYSRGYLNDAGELRVQSVESISKIDDSMESTKAAVQGSKYNLIVIPDPEAGHAAIAVQHEAVGMLLTGCGAVVGLLPTNVPKNPDLQLITTDVMIGDESEKIVVGKIPERPVSRSGHRILVVQRGHTASFNDALVTRLDEHFNHQVDRVDLSMLTTAAFTSGTTVVCTAELYEPLLATLSESDMASVKLMTDNAASILWIHGGDNVNATRPDFAIATGFSRSLVMEQPSLRFFTYDIDDPEANIENSVMNILATIDHLHDADYHDLEVVEQRGVPFFQRFVPEEDLNTSFRQKWGNRAAEKNLGEAKPVRLTIDSLGQFDTLAFAPELRGVDELNPNFVELDVKSIGLNAKDVYAYSGKVDTQGATTSLECAGVVARVGSAVQSLKVGDRVVCMAPGHFSTLESFPEWACAKLEDHEGYHTVSTLPLVFATALYGLCDRANIQPDESVLIHSGAGGVGIAAIQIAHLKGATVFTTVSTEEKKDFLVNKLGVKRENIFNSRDSSFLPAIMAATNGKGVNVVLNSLIGDLLHDSWRCCARFGRFVEIGKRDITDAGKLDMKTFKRNVTFTAFDVSELCDVNDRALSSVWERLLKDVMRLYRDGKIEAFDPCKVFDASEISDAFRHFGSKNRMGKIAISFEDDSSKVHVLPQKYNYKFTAEKTYLLSGCLGGIGRSISKWMMRQGARKFAFIGRSGLDKEPARRLVKDLEEAGADVIVTRGDVIDPSVVQSCVNSIIGPIGGVIQAAMGLDEALWTSMSHKGWHTSIDPKVQGSWNLHNALQTHMPSTTPSSTVDFFLLTSSVSGSVGTATQSNYTAANSFLDNFAKHRRAQGLPALSIGLGAISEVGYLHENPDIEAVLLRKGITPLKEEELLSILDLSLSRPAPLDPSEAHVLTGLETQGMKRLRRMGFEGTIPTLNDPRAAILASSLDGESDLHSKKTEAGLPPALAAVLESDDEPGPDAVKDVLTTIVVQRLANLILVPAGKIDRHLPLVKWGMDSMLAAEFRTWFFMAFAVDVPFLLLLGDSVTPAALGELVMEEMVKAGRFTL